MLCFHEEFSLNFNFLFSLIMHSFSPISVFFFENLYLSLVHYEVLEPCVLYRNAWKIGQENRVNCDGVRGTRDY